MKKIFNFIIIGISATSLYAQWTEVASGTNTYLHSVFFPTSQVGYIAGGHPTGNLDGVILKTIDGGLNWNIIHSDNNLSFKEAIFLDASTGVVVTFSNILRTSDGGQNWQTINLATSMEILDLTFTNGTFHILGKPNGGVGTIIYQSSDMGISWNLIYQSNSVFLGGISFIDSMHGFACEGEGSGNAFERIYKTNDGGYTWQKIPFQIYNYTTHEILVFSNPMTGFSGAWYGAHLMKTNDGGNTWQALNIDNGGMPQIYFISIKDSIVYAGGPKLFRSDDFGVTWSQQQIPTTVNFSSSDGFNDLFVINKNTIVAVGYGGTIIRTTNGGSLNVKKNTVNGKIKIYPNPADNKLNIKYNSNLVIQKICLTDLRGRLVKEYTENLNKLDVSDIATGNYLLQVYTEQGKITKKVVIK